jgi:hypothetical protein
MSPQVQTPVLPKGKRKRKRKEKVALTSTGSLFQCFKLFIYSFYFFVVPGFELKAYILSTLNQPFFVVDYFQDRVS